LWLIIITTITTTLLLVNGEGLPSDETTVILYEVIEDKLVESEIVQPLLVVLHAQETGQVGKRGLGVARVTCS
jgi:hypothetical protein